VLGRGHVATPKGKSAELDVGRRRAGVECQRSPVKDGRLLVATLLFGNHPKKIVEARVLRLRSLRGLKRPPGFPAVASRELRRRESGTHKRIVRPPSKSFFEGSYRIASPALAVAQGAKHGPPIDDPGVLPDHLSDPLLGQRFVPDCDRILGLDEQVVDWELPAWARQALALLPVETSGPRKVPE
jgi:hypothetical protein